MFAIPASDNDGFADESSGSIDHVRVTTSEVQSHATCFGQMVVNMKQKACLPTAKKKDVQSVTALAGKR